MNKRQLQSAVKLATGKSNWYRCSPYVQALARSLSVYIERGEFTGSVQSAKQCLEQAGYEYKGGAV